MINSHVPAGPVADRADIRDYPEVSARTYNICKNEGLLDTTKLLAFYLKMRSFSTIPGAGLKTQMELRHICTVLLTEQRSGATQLRCATYKPEVRNAQAPVRAHRKKPEPLRKSHSALMAPADLPVDQLTALTIYIRQQFGLLPVRAQHAMLRFRGGPVSYEGLYRTFCEERPKLSKLKNTGLKTLSDIQDFLTGLEHYARVIARHDFTGLQEEFLRPAPAPDIHFGPPHLPEFVSVLLENRQPVFAFLQKLLLGNFLFPANRLPVIKHRFGWFEHTNFRTLEAIGADLGVTRERVCQLSAAVSRELPVKLGFLHACKDNVAAAGYALDGSKDLIQVNPALAAEINGAEGTTFTPGFFALAFSIVYRDTHQLFGFDFENGPYLLRNTLAEDFDFHVFVADIRTRLKKRKTDDPSKEMEVCLSDFLKTNDPASIRAVRTVCESLLTDEFGGRVRLHSPETLVFGRNTERLPWEYTYAAKESIDRPAALRELERQLPNDHANFHFSREETRGAFLTEKTALISLENGRQYGLCKWDTAW